LSQRLPQRAGLNAMFQLNSWIPLVGASSKLAVRNVKNLTTRQGALWNRRILRSGDPKACQFHNPGPSKSLASDIQPLEPMLLPKLRIHFADFPWSHCSMDQRLFTSESGCGYRYGPSVRDVISGRTSVRIIEDPNGAQSAPLSLGVQTPSSNWNVVRGVRIVKEKRKLSSGSTTLRPPVVNCFAASYPHKRVSECWTEFPFPRCPRNRQDNPRVILTARKAFPRRVSSGVRTD